jgi:hypothetical protein
MNRKKWLFALLAVAVLATLALSPLSPLGGMLMRKNNIQAGGAGGEVMASASYRMESSIGGPVQVIAGSAGYNLCSGFACVGYYRMDLPIITR